MSESDDLKQKLWKLCKLKHFVNNTQKEAVKAILKRDQDVVISMGPGNRKSLCFQLPGIMQENKITIVCSASSSSIRNQMHYLKKSKISATTITSQLSDDERERLNEDVTSDKPTTRFIYVKPELASNEFFTNILQTLSRNDRLAYFAVCDAHLASPLLPDFCQDYLKFGSLRPAYPSVPWITLTHNASVDVRNDIMRNLKLREPVGKFTKTTFRRNLHHDIIFKNTIQMDLFALDVFAHIKNFLLSRLETDADAKKPVGIVYCKDRETVDMVAAKLTDIGLSTKAHHGGMTSSERKKVLDDWLTGRLQVVTATTSFGAGKEKSAVRVVVHFDVPLSIIGFYKESGIAGRDGKLSYSRIYYCKSDVSAVDSGLKNDIAKSKDENARRKALRAHADFLKMSDLCETAECRHKIFSNYFHDTVPNCIDKCDVCTNPQDAKVALELFYKFSATPALINGSSDMATFGQVVIKSEPHHHVNGQSAEESESGTQPTTSDAFRPSRSVSPANTIIKEENTGTGNHTNKASDELFSMKTRPPRNVSPARTLVKDEPVTGIKQDVEDDLNNSSVLGWNRTLPPRCVSPAETLIDEKPFRTANHTVLLSDELFAMKAMPPGHVSPAKTMVKKESEIEPNGPGFENSAGEDISAAITQPRRCVSPAETVIDVKPVGLVFSISHSSNSANSGLQGSNQVIIKSEPKSPVRPIDESDREPLERAGSLLITTENADRVLAESRNPIAPTANDPIPDISPFLTVIKTEAFETKTTDATSPTDQELRSPSPTGTIIKDESMSPAHYADIDVDFLENVSEDDEESSTVLTVNSERSRSRLRNSGTDKLHAEVKAKANPPDQKLNSEITAEQDSNQVIIKSEPKSPVRPIDESNTEPLERASSPLIRTENASTANDPTPDISPFLTVIKPEAFETQTTDATSRIFSDREVRSPSPTGTIIKDESMSPAHYADLDVDFLENVSEDDEETSTVLTVNSERSRSRLRNSGTDKLHTEVKAKANPPDQKLNSEMNTDSSSRPEFVSSEIVGFSEANRLNIDNRNSTSRQRNRSRSSTRSRSTERFKRVHERRRRSRSKDRLKHEKNDRRRSRSRSLSRRRSRSRISSRRRSRSRSKERRTRKKERTRSRSTSNERLKRRNERRRRSRSKDQPKSAKNVRRRSRSLSSSQSVFSKQSSSKERLTREKEGGRRGHSKERFKREKSVDRTQSSSSNSKRSQTSSRSERINKKQRYSNDSDTDATGDRNHATPSTSTSAKNNRNFDSQWSNRRFSVSPDRTNHGTEPEDDDDHNKPDYGWEDPAPPKPKPEEQVNSMMDDANVRQKMQEVDKKLKTEFDLDKIEESQKELFRAIQEKIEANAKKKLNDLTDAIRKKQDEHIAKLFGTNNFDNWDDDPALSNVHNVEKLQPFKALVPDDLPLYENMTMNHVIIAMKLQPTIVGNEIMVKGHIKEIENQFQDQEMPRHLVETIKQEKQVIAEWVKKYLTPYYKSRRIQSDRLYADVARKICHYFYDHPSDEKMVRRYVDRMFVKCGTITDQSDINFLC